MRAMETQVTIPENRLLSVQLPADITPGQHRLILMIDENRTSQADKSRRLAKMRAARGLWKDHKDIPDLEELRTAWERKPGI
ncbi:MAG: hypothetical protein GY862_31840 [Gammaproteobacteria bacterium]|nr:hypothetical protein [Gammaproteobacteria bacterium]